MSTQHHQPTTPPDIRLVVTDMDGTLLDGDGNIPDSLWPLLTDLNERGIAFCPASGRQYATLAAQFDDVDDGGTGGMVYVAENGAYVLRGGAEISSDQLEPSVVEWIVKSVRQLAADGGADVGAVVCGKRSAYVERSDEAFMEQVRKYYAAHEVVADATAVEDDFVKVALFDFGTAQDTTAPLLAPLADSHQVVVSSQHWIDVMHPAANKGAAVRRLQAALGVTPAQTVVFGDYRNDLEMLDTADWSYAMANAHPDVLARARHRAPANTEDGVVRTVRELLRRADEQA